MKIRADEHVSLEIVKLIRDLSLSDGYELSHVFDVGHGSTDDVMWITRFARDGGSAILTADGDFVRRPHQVVAVCDTGLKVIHLPPKWQNAGRRLQAAHVLLWWPSIEAKLASCSQRECWRVPWAFSEIGELTKVTLDFQVARKKVKKSARREAEA